MSPSANYPQEDRSQCSDSQELEPKQELGAVEQPTSGQLKAAISKTAETAARAESSASPEASALLIFTAIVRRYPDQLTLTYSPAAVELVTALASSILPSPLLQRVIERFSNEIAQQLLSDPIASRHLNSAWNVARRILGLTAQ